LDATADEAVHTLTLYLLMTRLNLCSCRPRILCFVHWHCSAENTGVCSYKYRVYFPLLTSFQENRTKIRSDV